MREAGGDPGECAVRSVTVGASGDERVGRIDQLRADRPQREAEGGRHLIEFDDPDRSAGRQRFLENTGGFGPDFWREQQVLAVRRRRNPRFAARRNRRDHRERTGFRHDERTLGPVRDERTQPRDGRGAGEVRVRYQRVAMFDAAIAVRIAAMRESKRFPEVRSSTTRSIRGASGSSVEEHARSGREDLAARFGDRDRIAEHQVADVRVVGVGVHDERHAGPQLDMNVLEDVRF